MTQHDYLRWRAGDTFLIVTVLLAALLLLLGLFLLPARGGAVQVTVDGEIVATLPLSTDTTLVIDGVGGENTLVIKTGEAFVTAADCPDGVCTRHRSISRAGQSILCLPHKVAVTVIGGDSTVDGEV